MNCKRDMVIDIVIEQLFLQSIVIDIILVDKIYHNISSLIGKKCWNNHLNQIAIIKGFFTYEGDIFAHAEEVTKFFYVY